MDGIQDSVRIPKIFSTSLVSPGRGHRYPAFVRTPGCRNPCAFKNANAPLQRSDASVPVGCIAPTGASATPWGARHLQPRRVAGAEGKRPRQRGRQGCQQGPAGGAAGPLRCAGVPDCLCWLGRDGPCHFPLLLPNHFCDPIDARQCVLCCMVSADQFLLQMRNVHLAFQRSIFPNCLSGKVDPYVICGKPLRGWCQRSGVCVRITAGNRVGFRFGSLA